MIHDIHGDFTKKNVTDNLGIVTNMICRCSRRKRVNEWMEGGGPESGCDQIWIAGNPSAARQSQWETYRTKMIKHG